MLTAQQVLAQQAGKAIHAQGFGHRLGIACPGEIAAHALIEFGAGGDGDAGATAATKLTQKQCATDIGHASIQNQQIK